MLPDLSFASHVLQSTPDLASKEQIGVFNGYKLAMIYVLGYITIYAAYVSSNKFGIVKK